MEITCDTCGMICKGLVAFQDHTNSHASEVVRRPQQFARAPLDSDEDDFSGFIPRQEPHPAQMCSDNQVLSLDEQLAMQLAAEDDGDEQRDNHRNNVFRVVMSDPNSLAA